jgi:hypothetical protein
MPPPPIHPKTQYMIGEHIAVGNAGKSGTNISRIRHEEVKLKN